MIRSHYTTDDLTEVVEREGLEQLLAQGLDASRIADPDLAALWREAEDALEAIRDHLGIGGL